MVLRGEAPKTRLETKILKDKTKQLKIGPTIKNIVFL